MKPYRTVPPSPGFSRRRFLSLPLMFAGLALPGAMRIAEAASMWEALNPAARPGPLSLGYWLGSDQLEDLDALSHAGIGPLHDLTRQPLDAAACSLETCAAIVDARSLDAGGSGPMGEVARVRIHGRYGTEGVGRDGSDPVHSLSVYVHSVSAKGPAFFAWGTGGDPFSESSSAQFRVPVDPGGRLQLSCEIGDSRLPESHGLNHSDPGYFELAGCVPLQFGTGFGEPRLRRGVYLLAWRGAAESPLPDWSGYRIASAQSLSQRPDPELAANAGASSSDPTPWEEPREIYSRLVLPAGPGAVRFPYLLISVDYPIDRV